MQIEGRSAAEQVEDSSDLVSSFAGACFKGWDEEFEAPRSDLRGFRVEALAFDPIDALFDSGRRRGPDAELRSDRVLLNGARFYSDHGHPEYATPECAHLTDLIAHDLAGERVVLSAARAFESKFGRTVRIYKNNTDYHGASYGAHESYLVPRERSFETLVHGLVPLMVVRPILVGAGKVGSELGKPCRFQLSQRADFFHETANVETLYRRPIFNTRDEPHASSDKWMRLHVICGDANRMPWCIGMKVGILKLALDLIDIGAVPDWRICQPVRTAESISKDERGEWKLELEGGSWTDGVQVLDSYLSAAERFLAGRDAETDWCLKEWRQAMEDLTKNQNLLCDRVDWVAKKQMLETFAEELGSWDVSRMQALELEYHNIDPDESLFAALAEMGQVREVVPEEKVSDAANSPPHDTRAYLRGEVVRRFAERIETIGWRRCVIQTSGDRFVSEFPVDCRDYRESQLFSQIENALSDSFVE